MSLISIHFLACLLGLIVYPAVIDYCVLPPPDRAPLRRRTVLVNFAVAHLLFALLLAVTGRLLLALFTTIVVLTAAVFISNAKYRALREPAIHADFLLVRQVFTHPRMYVPFFGTAAAVLLLCAIAAGLSALVLLEQGAGVAPAWRIGSAAYGALLLGLACACLFNARFAHAAVDLLFRPALAADPAGDVARHGLFAVLFGYWISGRAGRDATLDHVRSLLAARNAAIAAQLDRRERPLPRLMVAVQAESFFDARILGIAADRAVLVNYDRLLGRARCFGRLAVPTWGANTLRTEYAFLAGLDRHDLGWEAFHPYRHAAPRAPGSWVGLLRERGYETICIHPNEAAFFERDRAMPALGFGTFIDIGAFAGAEREAGQVIDAAFAERLIGELQRLRGPAFIFGISIQSHGPFFLKQKAAAAGSAPPAAAGIGAAARELQAYLVDLASIDAMIGRLVDALDALAIDYSFCLYGDHLPSLPAAYAAAGLTDSRTDYFILDRTPGTAQRRDLDATALFPELLNLPPKQE
jgi:hypothetical protein